MQICLSMFEHLALCCFWLLELFPESARTSLEYTHLYKELLVLMAMASSIHRDGFSCTNLHHFKFGFQAHVQCLSLFARFMKD